MAQMPQVDNDDEPNQIEAAILAAIEPLLDAFCLAA
jgi:hypothetical protein